ncbi:MAG: hypothetical protein WDZ73_01515 [Candidatus Paceibacterota bacterium]
MATQLILDFSGLFIFIAGFIIGLGAVTVIDLLGFLGQKSTYWTEATTRTHKVTKPLIWLGILLVIIGSLLFYRQENFWAWPIYHYLLILVLILNGWWLSFKVSPFLVERERSGHGADILPSSWQNKIKVSFIFSVLGWWTNLGLLVWYVVT